MRGVTKQVTVCQKCLVDHHFEPRGRFSIAPGPHACASILNLNALPVRQGDVWRFVCGSCRRPITLPEIRALRDVGRPWQHNIDCPPWTRPCSNCGYELSLVMRRTLMTCPACECLFDSRTAA